MPRIREYTGWQWWAEETQARILRDLPSAIAIDTETTGLDWHDKPFCVTLTWRGREGQLRSGYISLEHLGAYGAELVARSLTLVPTWVFHNAKFDLQKLDLVGALPAGWNTVMTIDIEDTQVIAALLDENGRKGLKLLAQRYLGATTDEDEVLKRVRRKLKLTKDDGYHLLPREVIVPYALKDTEFTLRLYEMLKPRLLEDVLPAYEREIAVTLVLLDMEANGIALDLPYLKQTASDYGVRVMEGWDKIVQLTGKPEFNPQSWQQLQAALADRGVHVDSTAEHVLRELDDDLARQILQYRSDKKMHTTYLKGLLTEQRDGIVHPWFNPVQARTGRMSSSSATQ